MNIVSKILKLIILFPMVAFFLPAFAFYMPGLNSIYLFYFIFLYISFLVLFITNYKYFIKNSFYTVKNTPLKIFSVVLLLIALNSIILSCLHITSFGQTFRAIVMQIILFISSIILYHINVVGKILSRKTFIKFFIFLFWINLIIGFISYLGQFLEIDCINKLFDFFANLAILAHQDRDMQTSNFQAFGLPRLDNLHDEPSHYAIFLFMFLPLIYSVGTSKAKIFKNKILNKIIKITIIPYTLLSMLLTFSPIYFIFTFVLTFILYFKKIICFFKQPKNLITFLVITLIILSIISFDIFSIDLSKTYLSRIINVLSNIKSFESFLLAEPSLASRVVCYINVLCIFFHHPLMGIGFGNLGNLLYTQFLNSPVTLDAGNYAAMLHASKTNSNVIVHYSFIYCFLAENGIIIFGVLASFFLNLYSQLNRFIQFNISNFDKTILLGFQGCLISISIISFYNLPFLNKDIYFLIGVMCAYMFQIKKDYFKQIYTNKKEENE